MICSWTLCDCDPMTTVPDWESIFAFRCALRIRLAIHLNGWGRREQSELVKGCRNRQMLK